MNKRHLTAWLDHKWVSSNFCPKEANGQLDMGCTCWSAGYCLAWPLSWNGYFWAYNFKAFIELREVPRVLKWFLCLGLPPIAQYYMTNCTWIFWGCTTQLVSWIMSLHVAPVCLRKCIHVPTLGGPLDKYSNMYRSMTTMGRELLIPSNGAELLIRSYKNCVISSELESVEMRLH